MQRAAQTFHMPTSEGWRTVAAGDELADDDLAVTTAPQYFVPVEPTAAEPEPAKARPAPANKARGRAVGK